MSRKKVLMSASAVAVVASAFVATEDVSAASHKVSDGDSLWSIAQANNVKVSDLKKWNNLTHELVFPDQVLQVMKPVDKANFNKEESNVEKTKTDTKTHIVISGDTLSEIAFANNISVKNLMELNNLNSTLIFPGNVLSITETKSDESIHTVSAGETLSHLALKYGTTAQKIADLNNMKLGDIIYVGDTLTIDGKSSSKTETKVDEKPAQKTEAKSEVTKPKQEAEPKPEVTEPKVEVEEEVKQEAETEVTEPVEEVKPKAEPEVTEPVEEIKAKAEPEVTEPVEAIEVDATDAEKQAETDAANAEQKQAETDAANAEQKQAETDAANAEQKQAETDAANAKLKQAETDAANAEQKQAETDAANAELKQAETDAANAEQKQAETDAANAEQKQAETDAANAEQKQAETDAANAKQKQAETDAANAEQKQAEADAAKPKPEPEVKPDANASTYTVKSGDTLAAIASAHETTAKEIASDSGISTTTVLHIGDKLSVDGTASNNSSPVTNTSNDSKPESKPEPTPKPSANAGFSANQLMNSADSVMGTKYVWGGTTQSGGFDCSGFIHWAYNDAGKEMPRTSTDGYHSRSYEISKSELQVGDLVFFSGTYRPGISHMGIYAGNNQFKHAATSTGVATTSLDNPYWSKHFDSFKRFY